MNNYLYDSSKQYTTEEAIEYANYIKEALLDKTTQKPLAQLTSMYEDIKPQSHYFYNDEPSYFFPETMVRLLIKKAFFLIKDESHQFQTKTTNASVNEEGVPLINIDFTDQFENDLVLYLEPNQQFALKSESLKTNLLFARNDDRISIVDNLGQEYTDQKQA